MELLHRKHRLFKKVYLLVTGARPPFTVLVDHVWGKEVDYDSDGDSRQVSSTDWTELYAAHRGTIGRLIVIDPVSIEPLIIEIDASEQEDLFAVRDFLVKYGVGNEIEYKK